MNLPVLYSIAIALWIAYIVVSVLSFSDFYYKDEKQLSIVTMLVKPGAGGVNLLIHLIETFTPYRVMPQVSVKVSSDAFTLDALADINKFEGNALTLEDHQFQVVTKCNIFGRPVYRLVRSSNVERMVIPVQFSKESDVKYFYLRTLIPALSMYQRKILRDIKAKANRKIY